jgi:alpha-glucosidase
MQFGRIIHTGIMLVLFNSVNATADLQIRIEKGECWWMGIVNHGQLQPLRNGYSADLSGNLYGNQAQPLLLSNSGAVIWSDDPFSIKVIHDSIFLSKPGGIFFYKQAATTLRGAYLYASKNFFPPTGKMPDELMFAKPQYNTWIELLYNQREDEILRYANSIISNGFPAGVIIIDDNWQEDYGKWHFHPARFINPKLMIDSLHRMGFKVVLWVCPFISPDSEICRYLESKQALLKSESGETRIVKWWNGYSAVLDLTHPFSVGWFKAQLDSLTTGYGVDGFKFDAGDPEYYLGAGSSAGNPNGQSELYAEIGLDYPLNEYRACWKMGGQPLAQRLRDKGHNWTDLQTLIPDILLQGLIGYPFTCPDMIGGGDMASFIDLKRIDQDLIVRSAQCHALMPMMQFSVAPWRVLDESHLRAVKLAVECRMQNADEILKVVKEAAISGEPVVRYMEYEFPGQGYASITDQFMLGKDMLIAPFLDNTTGARKVYLPEGRWKDDKGKILKGPQIITIISEMDRIPYYKKMK